MTFTPDHRPTFDQRVRLIRLATARPDAPTPQAAVGDIVRVIRTRTPPGYWYGGEEGCLWIEHWGGENWREHMATYGHLRGTAGIWELVES
jgi:hypothetical protein